MRKFSLVATAISVIVFQFSVCQAQEVTIKKGKATMTEQQYLDLKAKADAYDQAVADLKQARQAAEPLHPQSFNDSASYAIGRDIYHQWQRQNLGIDGRMAGQAMRDCMSGTEQLNDRQANPLLQRFQQNFEQRQRAGVQDNIRAGEKYMAEISNNKSVYTTESGLKYRRLKEGNGKRPKATDRVKVHYTGTLIDGKKFDSSIDRGEPITFPLNQVIPGWTEGLQLMDEGSTYMLYIPYNLGYGEQPVGDIPAGSTLIFEVQLLEINPK